MDIREWIEKLVTGSADLRTRMTTRWQDYVQQPSSLKLKLLAVILFGIAIVMSWRKRRE